MPRRPSRRPQWFPLWPAVLCTILVPGTGRLTAAPTPVGAPLKVMNLNIFYGGDELNLQSGNFCVRADGCPETLVQVIEEIRRAAPDVVGLEEGEHNACPIALALGWNCSARMQIISRLPLIDPPGGDGTYIFVQTAPGKVVAMMNVHLPSDPYGPYLVRDGGTEAELRALEESVRLPAIHDQLAALPGLLRAGIPVFLTGDFNSPSHLDWTPAVAAVRPEVRFPFDWPVSHALADAGFRDGYRVAHPDPVAVPGFTWTPGGPESVTNEVHDRIDWVLAAGNAVARASTVVGEPGFPDAGVTISPYPTDHRGVITTFDVTAGTPPILVAVSSRRVFIGETQMVTFHARGRAGEAVVIVPAGAAGSAPLLRRPTNGAVDGTVTFATGALAPGAYEAVLLDASGTVLSRSPFWLYPPGSGATLVTSKSQYVSGEPITVSWTNAPGSRWDWLGIYSPGESDGSKLSEKRTSGYGGNGHYRLYTYTRTAIEGTATFSADSFVGYTVWPLQPGNYEIRLLLDDGYRSLGSSAPFKVVKP
jgi:hypothetical protein